MFSNSLFIIPTNILVIICLNNMALLRLNKVNIYIYTFIYGYILFVYNLSVVEFLDES